MGAAVGRPVPMQHSASSPVEPPLGPTTRRAGRRGTRRAPKWHVVYSLLALFDVLVVGAGLVYIRSIVHSYNSSMSANGTWEDRQSRVIALERSAASLVGPASQVLLTKAPAVADAALERAVGSYELRSRALRSELSEAAPASFAPTLADLDLADALVAQMAGTSRSVIDAARVGETALGYQYLATLIEQSRSLTDRLTAVSADLQTARTEAVERRRHDVAGLQKFEYLIEAMFLVMVLGATVYGSRLRNEFERRSQEQARQLSELEAAKNELTIARQVLDDRVAARTADLDRMNRVLRAEVEERRRAEADLRLSEERYAIAAESANDGLWDWDLRSGQFYTSPRWRALLGLGDESFGGTINEWFDRVHPDDRVSLQIRIGTHLQDPKQPLEMEHRMLHTDGTYHWMLMRATAVGEEVGQPTRMVGSHTDVTDRKNVEMQLLHVSRHDTLTGLANRAYFMDHLDTVMRTARLTFGSRFAVLFVDLDRFKSVNDSLGHAVGDALLREVGVRLTRVVRPGDMVSRLGGDEFTILVEDVVNDAGAVAVAQRVLAALSDPIVVDGFEIRTGASIGIAFGSPAYTSPSEILRDADTAMYNAKSEGRGSYRVFESAMHDSEIDALLLASELALAVERNQFELNFQPVVDLATQRLVGSEALVRWRHPEYGLVSPSVFLGIAETNGAIIDIGRWVIEHACAQAKQWHSNFPVTEGMYVAVNVSPKELWEDGFVEFVEATLERHHLGPAMLRLEIVEAGLMRNQIETESAIRRLASLGVGIVVDDFGTGHATTTYLRSLPLAAIKIDRSLVALAPNDTTRADALRAEVERALLVGVEVIGEGIETADQEALVADAGCRFAQGYRYSAPLGVDEATGWLIARQRAKTTG